MSIKNISEMAFKVGRFKIQPGDKVPAVEFTQEETEDFERLIGKKLFTREGDTKKVEPPKETKSTPKVEKAEAVKPEQNPKPNPEPEAVPESESKDEESEPAKEPKKKGSKKSKKS